MPQHTLIAMLLNRPGVLHRTVTLLRRRGYNIESLSVGPSELPSVSRMTLVVDASNATHVVRQLDRLVDVLVVSDITGTPSIQRETAMIKLVASVDRLSALATLAQSAGARVLDHGSRQLIIEITDTPARVDGLLATLPAASIAEVVRTGRLAMLHGHSIAAPDPSGRCHAQADGASHDEAA